MSMNVTLKVKQANAQYSVVHVHVSSKVHNYRIYPN